MKYTFASVLLCLFPVLPGLAQTPVSSGSGSYASFTPAAEETTDSYYALPQNQVAQFFNLLHLDPSQAGKPIPTNHWWTDLLVGNRSFLPSTPPGNTQYTLQQDAFGGNQWFIPGMLNPESYGMDVYFPNTWKAPNANGNPQGTIDAGLSLQVRGDVPYSIPVGDLLIADFENGYPAGTVITGSGFATPPSTGSGLTGLMGTRCASTRDGGNGAMGVVRLPSFTVNKHYLHFLICGGNFADTQVRLVIGGTTVLSAQGVSSTAFRWVRWDLTPYTGQTAWIEIVDQNTGSWGFLACDQIVASDSDNPVGRFGGDLVATNTTVTGWSDWSVDFNLADAYGRKVDVTMTRGVPFTWTRWTSMKPKIILGAATTFYDVNNQPITVTAGSFTASAVAFNARGKNYGIFLPDSTVCTVGGSGATTYLQPQISGSNNYMVIGYLPALTDLNEFAGFAYARPTNTQISWALSPTTGRINTTWTITTTALKGTNLNTIQGWIPHHYRTTTHNLTFKPYTYQTQRGIMKCASGTSFQLNFPLQGIAPVLPAPTPRGLTNDFQPDRMTDFLNRFNPGGMLGETYGCGKGLALCAQYMCMADQMGDTANFNRLKTALTTAMTNWFTYTPGEANGFFALYPEWKAMIGWDASYGSQAFNDLHFHYGYFAIASALLGKYDSNFLTNYGPMIRNVVKVFANYDRADTTEPFLRTFDVWEGHGNAGGLSGSNGENQESSSEAMNSWAGVYLLGSMLNDNNMTAVGAMGFAMESASVNEYWQDLYQSNFPASFDVAGAGMVWSDNFTYATYFSGDPAWIYAIQYVPSNHWNNYLVRDQQSTVAAKYLGMWNERADYYNSFPVWNSATSYNQYVYISHSGHLYYANVAVPAGQAAPNANSNWVDTGDYSSSTPDVLGGYPGDYVLAYQALWDADNCATMFDNYYTANEDIARNGSWAGSTYYLIHSMRQLGVQDFSYTCSVPTAAVYYNATTNTRTAVVYNPASSSTTATLYKNGSAVQNISVAARSHASAYVGSSPVITSAWNGEAMVSRAFTYQITATNSPTSYSATGLPSWLTLNSSTGVLSGTPSAAGTTTSIIRATNASGTGSANLVITVYPFTNPPVVNSPTSAPATVGVAFSYQITATNSPTSYTATNLPAGLTLNSSSGVISGTIDTGGIYNVTIGAKNVAGTGTAALSISCLTNFGLNQPATSSSFTTGSEAPKANDGSGTTRWLAASGAYPQWWRVDLGTARSISRVDISWFSPTNRYYQYKIEGSDNDTDYTTIVDRSANTTFGATSDSFTAVSRRFFRVTVTGSSSGYASAYEIGVFGLPAIPAPVITSPTTAVAITGSPFSYQIAATNSPTSYAATGLPSGLTINSSTGLITGTGPVATAAVTVSATNSGGTGTASLTIQVDSNVALGKTATASSFQAGNEVAKGNDGNATTRWAAADGAYPQWWKVNLGTTMQLSRMDIDWFSPATRSYRYKIEVSTDDLNYMTVKDNTSNTVNGATSDSFTATAQYVKVTVTGASGGFASAYEFKVWGH